MRGCPCGAGARAGRRFRTNLAHPTGHPILSDLPARGREVVAPSPLFRLTSRRTGRWEADVSVASGGSGAAAGRDGRRRVRPGRRDQRAPVSSGSVLRRDAAPEGSQGCPDQRLSFFVDGNRSKSDRSMGSKTHSWQPCQKPRSEVVAAVDDQARLAGAYTPGTPDVESDSRWRSRRTPWWGGAGNTRRSQVFHRGCREGRQVVPRRVKAARGVGRGTRVARRVLIGCFVRRPRRSAE